MTFLEVVESGKLFKRKNGSCWYRVTKGGNVVKINDDNSETLIYLDISFITAIDFVIKEEWYEGDFKKKYPNGVLCWVYDKWEKKISYRAVVVDYTKESGFKITVGYYYSNAEPVTKKDAPTIIEEGK